MIYKHARLEKKLREHGRFAPAEILSMRTEGSGNSGKKMFAPDDDLTASWTLARLDLRVMPEGEPPFDVTVRTRLNTFKYKGDTVPVLYDPDDHDKVVVDYEADAQATMESQARPRETPPSASAPGAFAQEAAAFAEQAAAFREQAAGLRASIQQPTGGSPARPPGASDPLERLQKLADLHDHGVLTDAEFAAEKGKILGAD